MNNAPTVGRIVLFKNVDDRPEESHPALITGLNADGTVDLRVFYRKADDIVLEAAYSETPAANTWSWPTIGNAPRA